MKKKTKPIKTMGLIVEKTLKKKRDTLINIQLMDFRIKMVLKWPQIKHLGILNICKVLIIINDNYNPRWILIFHKIILLSHKHLHQVISQVEVWTNCLFIIYHKITKFKDSKTPTMFKILNNKIPQK